MRKFEDYEAMAMLELSETERQRLRKRFDEIVDSFSQLDAYDTEGLEPLTTVVDLQNVMREDVSSKMISRNDLLANAPDHNEGFFRAPAAIN